MYCQRHTPPAASIPVVSQSSEIYPNSKMKLFIVAALIAISSAARLEHLEQQKQQEQFQKQLKAYLPPDHEHGQQAPQLGFGQQNGQQTFGQQESFGQPGAFGQQGSFGQQGAFGKQSSFGARGQASEGAIDAATLNQYLPPDHGPSGAQQAGAQAQFGQNQYSQFRQQTQNKDSNFGGQFGQASNGASGNFAGQQAQGQFNRPQAPKDPFQNIPQQAFDDKTGYIY